MRVKKQRDAGSECVWRCQVSFWANLVVMFFVLTATAPIRGISILSSHYGEESLDGMERHVLLKWSCCVCFHWLELVQVVGCGFDSLRLVLL